MVECLIVVQFHQLSTAPTSMREVDRVSVQMNWTRGENLTLNATIASELWDPVDTVTQDIYEDILFFREDNLLFTAEHELWPMVSGRRRMACGVGTP